MARQLAELTRAQLITPDPDLENRLRAILDLPELQPTDSSAAFRAAEPKPEPRSNRYRFAARLDIDTIRQKLGRLRSDFREHMMSLLTRQLEAIAQRVERILRAASQEKPLRRGALLARLSAIEVPYLAEYRSLIRHYLIETWNAAWESFARSTGTSPPRTIPNELRSILNLQADLIARKHAGDLLYAALQQVLDDWNAGLDVTTIVWNITQRMRERASTTADQTLTRAVEALQEAINTSLRTSTMQEPQAE